ncbi:7-carboxy-7-deazaguanine synthase QueE [bacterium]|nr:7-carboxy-7-deazaguanine synthase QueE [bacterium]
MSSAESLLVNEIYPCLQGEGTNLGKPAILVRLQICNLRCSWCDTPYTHTTKSDPIDSSNSSSAQRFRRMKIGEVVGEILKHKEIRHVIISGGEPTLQNFSALLEALQSTHSVEIETNGTQIPHLLHGTFGSTHYLMAQWNVSPKGKNAGEKLEYEALSHWAGLSQQHPNVYFKFVIRKDHCNEDVAEVLALVNQFSIETRNLVLMPEGTTVESQLSNAWLEEICLRQGWRMSPRLHVLTHGPRRGV